MAYLRAIVTDGHPTLRRVAKRVTPREIADPLFQQLIDDMFETMYDAPGVGLAAPQVNVSKRLFVMDVRDDEREPAVVINPKLELAEDEKEMTEGCLSVPGYVGEITRFNRVVVTGLDRNGEKIRLEGEDCSHSACSTRSITSTAFCTWIRPRTCGCRKRGRGRSRRSGCGRSVLAQNAACSRRCSSGRARSPFLACKRSRG